SLPIRDCGQYIGQGPPTVIRPAESHLSICWSKRVAPHFDFIGWTHWDFPWLRDPRHPSPRPPPRQRAGRVIRRNVAARNSTVLTRPVCTVESRRDQSPAEHTTTKCGPKTTPSTYIVLRSIKT